MSLKNFYLFIFVIFLISSLSAVTYLNSSNIFDAEITYLNDKKIPYSVIINIDTLVDENLNYKVELIHKKQNRIISQESINCKKSCELKLLINEIYFDDYEIRLKTKFNRWIYEKTLPFNLEFKESNFKVDFKKNYPYFPKKPLNIKAELDARDDPGTYFFHINPVYFKNEVEKFQINCTSICNLNFNLTKSIVFGKYTVKVYSQLSSFEKSFNVFQAKKDSIFLNDFNTFNNLSDNNKSILNISNNLKKKSKKITKAELFERRKYISQFGNPKKLHAKLDLIENKIKSREIRIISISEKLKNKFDLNIDLDDNNIEFKNLSIDNLDEINFKKDSSFGTDIVHVEVKNNNFSKSIVSLKKVSSSIDKILVCNNFSINPANITNDLNNISIDLIKNSDNIIDFNENSDTIINSEFFFSKFLNNSLGILDESEYLEYLEFFGDDLLEDVLNISDLSNNFNDDDDDDGRILNSVLDENIEFSTLECPGGWVDSNIDFESNSSHVWFEVDHFSAYAGSIEIFNPQSYPTVAGIWKVEFKTNGTADLWISASNSTIWSNSNDNGDLRFLDLYCGGNKVDYEWINDSVFVENYFCLEKSYERSKVITKGKHVKKFVFANSTAYAKNFASDRGSGFLAYIESTVQTPRYRVFDPDTDTWSGELSANSVGNSIEELQVACSVGRHECALLTVDSGDDVQIQFYNGVCWHNGSTCGQTYVLETTSDNEIGQRANLMYEQVSGDLLVTWVTASTDDIEYRTWNGSVWSLEGQIQTDLGGSLATAGNAEWIELAQKPGTNNISMIYRTSSNEAGVVIYDGNSKSFLCELSTPFTGIDTSIRPNVDIAHEQISGDLFAVGGISSSTEYRYVTKSSGSCTYSGIQTSTQMSDGSDAIRIAPVWNSDTIIIATRQDSNNDVDWGAWNGSNELNDGAGDGGSEGEVNGNIQLAIACPKDGTDRCISPYADNNDPSVSFRTYTPSSNLWSNSADYDGTPAMSTNLEVIECTPYPFVDDSKIMCIFKDESDDIFAKYYDASTSSWTDTEGGSALETSSNQPSDYKSFSFNWVIFDSPYLPIDINPVDGESLTQINLNLTTEVRDGDGGNLNVSFYWANGTFIGTNLNVVSGSNTSYLVNNLSYLTNYSWYVVVDDGEYQAVRGSNWNFSTKDRTGTLSINIITPSTASLVTVYNTKKFKVNVTLSCIGILDESCYNISIWTRYNDTASTMNNISLAPSSPFYADSYEFQNCILDQGESCSLEWLITPNTSIGSMHTLNLYAITNRSLVGDAYSLNVSLNVSPPPPPSVIWSISSLDFGSNGLNLGNLTEAASITIIDDHTGVNVTCLEGNCSVFVDNFIDGSDYNETDDPLVSFTCLDNIVGNFSANFTTVSNEDTVDNVIELFCQINQTYGNLDIILNEPVYNVLSNYSRYENISLNATISCIGTSGAICGDITVNSRWMPYSWWNNRYKHRKGIQISEPIGLARDNDLIFVNISGLSEIDSCLEDTRIVSNWSGVQVEVTSQILSGDNSTYCEYLFLGNVSASASNEVKYYVYYTPLDEGSDPSYTSLISSSDDGFGWDLDNSLISWDYSWTGGSSGGPWRTNIFTPGGISASSISSSGDDSFEAADTFTSFSTIIDGPLYKEFILESSRRGEQTMKVYAMQNWYDINNQYSHGGGGANMYFIINIEATDNSARGYWDFSGSRNNDGEQTASEFFYVDGNPSTWGVGVVVSGVLDEPFDSATASDLDFRNEYDGWIVRDDPYASGFSYYVFSTDNGIQGANTTSLRIKNPIDLSQTSFTAEESIKVINTSFEASPMYTNGIQPQICSLLTVGTNCNLLWNIKPEQGFYKFDINISSSLPSLIPKEVSNMSDVQVVWPIVNLSLPLNGTILNSFTGNFIVNITDNAGLRNVSLQIWNSTNDFIGSNFTNIDGFNNISNLNFTFPYEGYFYWNSLVYDLADSYAWNETNYTLIVDVYAPNITLLNPLNDSLVNITKQYFLGNLSDYGAGLKNVTLQIWNSTNDLIGSNFTNISGNEYQINLSFVLPYGGDYHWNYLVYDHADKYNYSINNFTITLDITPPNINFTFPTDSNNSYVDRPWTQINVSIFDQSFNSSWLSWNAVNETLTCNSISSLINICTINKSFLLNGAYTYFVCANDSFDSRNCSETRIININKSLPEITIISPLNSSKHFQDDIIYFNITTSIPANLSYYELESNSSIYNLTNTSSLNWSDNLLVSSLAFGFHNITFYTRDEIGNILNKSHIFYVLADKYVNINKSILALDNDVFRVSLNITNFGLYQDYILYDFIDTDYTYYNFSLSNDGFSQVSGFYTGDLLTWNLSLAFMSYINLSYYINSTEDYSLEKNFITAID